MKLMMSRGIAALLIVQSAIVSLSLTAQAARPEHPEIESNFRNFAAGLCGTEAASGQFVGDLLKISKSEASYCKDATSKMIDDAKLSGNTPRSYAEIESFAYGLVLKACTHPSPKSEPMTWAARRTSCFQYADKVLRFGSKDPEFSNRCVATRDGRWKWMDEYYAGHFNEARSFLEETFARKFATIEQCYEAGYKTHYAMSKYFADSLNKDYSDIIQYNFFLKQICGDSPRSRFGILAGMASPGSDCTRKALDMVTGAIKEHRLPTDKDGAANFKIGLALTACTTGDSSKADWGVTRSKCFLRADLAVNGGVKYGHVCGGDSLDMLGFAAVYGGGHAQSQKIFEILEKRGADVAKCYQEKFELDIAAASTQPPAPVALQSRAD